MDFDSIDKKYKRAHCSRNESLPVFGLVLVGMGFVFLLDRVGVLEGTLRHVILSWPMLLIFIGAISFFTSHSRFPGIVLFIIGGIFLLPRFDILPFETDRIFWPLVLMIIGLAIVFKGFRHRSPHVFSNPETINSTDTFEEVAIFGGGKRIINSQSLKGGRITAIFGGIELDLTQADFAGDTAEIEVSCVFGGTTIFVRPEWEVKVQVGSVMGGFSDKRNLYKTPNSSGKTLIIKGGVVFGGGELKSM